MPPLSALRAFEAAARLGSLSAAGRELNVTHAAIAQQIRKLEEWFSRPLLERTAKGVAPNDDGAQLAEGLTTGFTTLRRAVDRLIESDSRRPLIVSVTPSFASSWLIPRLGDFRASNPHVELTIDATPRMVNLNNGEADVAMRYGTGNWPGLEAERLFSSNLIVAAATTLLEGRKITKAADLLELPWVQETGTEEWRVWFREQGFADFSPPATTNLPGHLAIDAIRRGHGVGITTRTWIAEDIASGRVVPLFENEQSPDLGYYVVTRRGVPSPAVQAFKRWSLKQR